MTRLSPKKLLHSKWTTTQIVDKQKHFLVTRVLKNPAARSGDALSEIEYIEIEAIYSNKKRVIRWRELQDTALWQQGWK